MKTKSMRNRLIKKYSVMLVMGVYALSTFFQSFSFFDFNKVYAQEEQLDYTNLVAVFVDDKLYSTLDSDIQRYAKNYIQGGNNNTRYNAISNSKAIVLPVNTETITAPEITKILENMYFDGVSGEPSKLVGVVLIGEIPLPVVNQNGFVYPTIYPYVDFDEQKFIWDDDLKYFVYNDNPKGQPEIWHGLINFNTKDEYINYFDKLREYAQAPSEFIGKNIWYDDIIANKKYFNNDAVGSYINNFLFAEDLGYRRYTDLMVKLMQGSHNDMVSELLGDFGGTEELMSSTESMSTPTMTLETMVKEGYIKSYTSLIGGKQLDNIVKNVETANRWVEQYTGSNGEEKFRTSLDTHYLKMEQKDETLLRSKGGLDPLIIVFNNALENIVDTKIEKEKYWLDEVIPLTYLKYDGYEKFALKPKGKTCTWKEYNAYENYFFGTKASNITSMQETSTYRGTFRNYDNLGEITIDDIQLSQVPSTDLSSIDLNKKSVGGSYEIFATQVDANRGYDISNTVKELSIYKNNKIAKREYWNTKCDKKFLGICWRKRRRESDTAPIDHLCVPNNQEKQGGCEMPQEFAIRNRGGASPLNLSGMDSWLSGYRFQDAILPVYNIAGSKKIDSAENEANSFSGVEKYSRLVQKTFVPTQSKYYTKNKDKLEPDLFGLGYNSSMGEDMKFTNWIPIGNMDDPSWIYTNPIKANTVNFFNNFNTSANWQGDIIKITKEYDNECVGNGEIYTYKTLDSRVKNNLSTQDEINGTIYKIFKDKISPVKILYEGIIEKIDRLEEDVQRRIAGFDVSTQSGIVYNLNDLGNYVDDINNGLSSIANYPLSSLNNLNSTTKQQVANNWLNKFTQQDYLNVRNKSEDIRNQLLDLDGFADTFSYDYLREYIKDQLYNFQVNDWKLIFLYSWKTNILNKLINTKNKFYSIKGLVDSAKNEYDNINKVDRYNTLSAALLAKKIAINAHVTSNNDDNVLHLGCNNANYGALCNAIDTVRNNLSSYKSDLNKEVTEIASFSFDDLDFDGGILSTFNNFFPFNSIKNKIQGSNLNLSYSTIQVRLSTILTSTNTELTGQIKGMNITTSDRPIDSPKYITFKGVGGDKVTLIYPDLYKAEVFSGNSDILKLKSPEDIAKAIKSYLKEVVKKYNKDLLAQKNKTGYLYNQNPQAYNLLNTGDPLATPKNINNAYRPYNLINEDFLIVQLENKLRNNSFFTQEMGGYEPIEFISHMIYYQNIAWKEKKIGETIQEDIDNTRSNFDVNNKITHIVDNYLVKDNDKGNFITPGYRAEGYEVAFINSDGNDYITATAEPVFIQNIKSAASNYITPNVVKLEQTQIEEEMQNECNIPESEGVMLFDLQDMSSPWANALKCRWEKIKTKPLEFSFDRSSIQGNAFKLGQEGGGVEDFVSENLGTDEIQSQYINQLGYLDTEESNQEVLDNSSPGDYQKLEKITSYTKIETENTNINADLSSGNIVLSSKVELGNVEFYIKNIGDSLISLKDGNNWINGHITEGKTGYSMGKMTFDPFSKKSLEFKIENPIASTNVIVFYMCLPGTQNIENCVKKSLKLNIIPGQIKTIGIESPGNIVLQGSKMPISIKGMDSFGNNVGELFTEKFNISVSTGTLSHISTTNDKITFSNFNKSNFVLNIDTAIENGTEVRINVDGKIGGIQGTYASKIVTVRKGEIKVYNNTATISSLNIDLPAQNNYSYKDSFNITQMDLATVPKIVLKLQDNLGQAINIESIVNISSKNGLLKIGGVEERSVTKVQNEMSFEVIQKRFSQKNNQTIKSGELVIYFMPNFGAGEDVISISMPGIDTIQIPVTVNPAPASNVELNTKKETMATYAGTEANLKITDNWGNLITKDTMIKLGITGPLSISGINTSSVIVNVKNGNYSFGINSKDKAGAGFIYATIEGLAINEQKPGYKKIMVQEKILPEKDLNIMYINLFGNDWGNQRGFMSDNNKYVQKLISNSDKLLTATTQLVDPSNIKKFPIIIGNNLELSNIEDSEINLILDEKIFFEIKNIGNIKVSPDSFKIQSIDVSEENIEQVVETLIDSKYQNKNVFIYLPEKTDSLIEKNEIKNNAITINNVKVFDMNNKNQDADLHIKLGDEKIAGYQSWNVFLGNKNVGKILIVVKNESEITFDLETINSKYDINTIWINGSTNKEGIGFYEIDGALPDKSMGYESIQDSKDPTLSIGFTNNFKNITNFGAGKSVGESTINFASEFLINIGDPLLKRVSDNTSSKMFDEDLNVEVDSEFDKGIGELIYSEPGKTIFKVKNIDFNNDNLEDIIVSFTDGTIKILKNYGGNDPFKQLGDLMVLSDGIKEIIIGDVDGNGYEDIVIWSKSDLLRVYKNNMGVFDVDGLPICINTNVKNGLKSEKPQEIGGINQIFFEDMNSDGKLDIITNDKLGYIKIFYGGKTNGKDNYVSDNQNMCDESRYQRQTNNNNTKTVYRFGIRTDENIKVLDKSLVRWKGINIDEEITISAADLGVDTAAFDESNMNEDNIEETLEQAMNFDINQATQLYKGIERYKQANFGRIPAYEAYENENDVEYVEIGCLTGNDPVKIYKQYNDLNGDVLENGDKVQVTITIKANNNFTGTFIDNIVGPWKIPLTGDVEMIENFWFESGTIAADMVENKLKFHRNMANARYMIDNLSMKSGDEIKINYRIFYDGDTQTSKIELKDINGADYEKFGGNNGEMLDEYQKDGLLDIKIKPTDGCNKSMFVLFNENSNQKKEYVNEYIDLTSLLIDFSNTNQGNLENTMSGISNSLASNKPGEEINFDDIPGLSSVVESINITDMLSDSFNVDGFDLTNIVNIPSQMIDGLMGDVMDKVDKLMGDMCKGFDLSEYGVGSSENCGLPVPFNQAFLGPGEYHLFGCLTKPLLPLTNTIGKGLPVLTFPGNRPSPAGYLPFPGIFGLPFKGPVTDKFLGVPGGTNDSQFRLYVIPTLTAEIGIAMCFGPYSVGTAIPDPASSIAGNCIVTSVPLPCKDNNTSGPNTTNQIPEAFLDMEACGNQNVPCYIGDGESTSSLEMVSSSNATTNMTASVPDGSFAGGFINIEKEPITEQGYNKPESGIEIDGVKLTGGAKATNKILGGTAQGLIEKVSKAWMDSQIGYILNNFTNFKVDVAWPDFDSIFGGLSKDSFKEAISENKKDDCLKQKGNWDDKTKECDISDPQKCLNRGMERKQDKNICQKKVSPNQNEDALGKLDNWSQNNLISRSQITNLSESSFANPFDKIEAVFEEIPLVNIRTENITIKVPMISSEDITAYTSMSRNRITQQEKVLQEWFDLFKSMIGWCGGRTDIKNWKDFKDAVKELKDNMKNEMKDGLKNLEDQVKKIDDEIKGATNPEEKARLKEKKKAVENNKDEINSNIKSINKQIKYIKELNNKYDLSDLGKYDIFESCIFGEYLIKAETKVNTAGIIPYDIYLVYTPNKDKELKMFTQGFKLVETKQKKKVKISYVENGENISNKNLCIKSTIKSSSNQCTELFLGGEFDGTLNNFLNIQSNTTQLINSVKQNIETLELYKKFPIDLYERMHVGDRYMSEISSVISNFLGTLSLWTKTNATRYSQYVDSLILVMTTMQTYQAIIDLSVNWSEKCSSCTNDNYDQFACKLGLLCPDNALPVLEIPPMKIPSIYLDFSSINIGTDIKLPKFNFIPNSVPLPSLPNIPNPPKIDMSLDIEQALSMGVDLVGDLLVKLDVLDVGISLPAMPVIPAPPDLPEIPSFIPSVKLELPLLPPAPKIPKLPNEISAAIKIAEKIGQILCIVKSDIGLVGEGSIKAKVEQMSQRTYEVPYWDNLDQTLEQLKNQGKSKIPEWISDMFGFLKSNEFKDVELKGFDIGVESHVNLQYNFDGFYDFINSVVDQVNNYSSMPGERIQDKIDQGDENSRALENRMSACTTNPISEACLGNLYDGDIKKTKEKINEMEAEMKGISTNITNGFAGVKEAMQIIAKKENEKEILEEDNLNIEDTILSIKEKLDHYKGDLLITTDNSRIRSLKDAIDKNKNLLRKNEEKLEINKIKIKNIQNEIDELDKKYGSTIDAYEEYLSKYEILNTKYNELKAKLSEWMSDALDEVNKIIGSGDALLDDATKFEKLNERNNKIKQKMNEFEKKESIRKDQRWENLDNLYKDISYVDYDENIYEESSKVIKNTLNTIIAKSDDTSFNKKISEYINLIDMDKEIKPAINNIENIKTQYAKVVNEIQYNNKSLSDTISSDYDKFLYAVANNSKSLVSDTNSEISLSSKLFDMEDNTIDMIKQQENINKLYLDYNNDNIEGYLNALNNYSAKELNMSEKEHNSTKEYLTNINDKTKIAYGLLEDKRLISQNNQNPGVGSAGGSYVDVSNYINVIKTPEGSVNLDNKQYVKKFQGKTLMVDLNKDEKNDLILWDKNNVYVKYRGGNNIYENLSYNNKYYKYNIKSYNKLMDDSEEGFIKINNIYLKMCDQNREIKNFKYVGGDFDSIKASWTNSQIMGDNPKGYLIKMIHRSDLFSDKEVIVSSSNDELFDKKYLLVLPKGGPTTGMNINLEEGNYQIDGLLSGMIFDVIYYNENQNKINITVKEIPRNRQYSEIYALDIYEDQLYMISSPSSNQIVAGPQLIGDTRGPTPTIELYRPSIDTVIDTGERFDGYVSTKYTIRANWEDNISIDRIWITDNEGNILKDKNINQKTGYIELDNLLFTGVDSKNYYFVGIDTNGNVESTQVNMNIQKPNIKIVDIQKYGDLIENIGSPTNIIAELDNDIDEGYVQFLRNRNGIWQTITGTVGGIQVDKYSLNPMQTIITGGYYDFGNDIGLYLANGDLAVKVDPSNGKINILNGFENLVKIDLDYSMKTPMIKVSEINGSVLFWLSFSSEELIDVSTNLETKDLQGDIFGDFNGGKGILKDNEILLYISPKGSIYANGLLYGNYSFNDNKQSITYSFRDKIVGDDLGKIEIKIKNLLSE